MKNPSLIQAVVAVGLLVPAITAYGQPVKFVERIVDENSGKPLAADINNDGKNDIVVHAGFGKLDPSEKHLAWLEYPSFTKHIICFANVGGDRIAAGDLDGDGDIDVVTTVGEGKANIVTWYENPLPNGDPRKREQWKAHPLEDHGGWAKDVHLADFDGNGTLEIAVRSHQHTKIYYREGGSWTSHRIEHPPKEGLAIGDLDLDGDPDLVLNGFWLETPSQPFSGQYKLHVIDKKWYTQNTGEWRDNCAYTAVADINGDGLLDVVIAHSEKEGYPISWYSVGSLDQVKTGPWREHVVAAEFDWAETLQAGDIDNDGDVDLLAAKFLREGKPGDRWFNEPPYPVMIFYNVDGKGLRWEPQTLSEEGAYSAYLGDVGSDGDLDVVGALSYWRGPAKIWENQSADRKLPVDRWTYIEVDNDRRGSLMPGSRRGGLRAFGLAMGDATGDGYADIVSGQYFYRNPGGDMTGKWERFTFPIEVDAILMLDVDGDEYADVIGQALPDVYWLEARDKTGENWSALRIGSLPSGNHGNTQLYGLGQLVPGGKPEIVLGAESPKITVYFQIPDNPELGNWPRTDIASEGGGYAVGDIDGDGFNDVAGSYNVETDTELVPGTLRVHWWMSRMAWWKNPGDGTGDWKRYTVGESTHADRFELADLNGDGRLDLITTEERYPGMEPNASMYWFEQPADPTAQWTRHEVVKQFSMNNLDAADVDRDGDIDLATSEHRNPRGGVKIEETERTQIWINDGKGNFTAQDLEPGKESHLGAQLYDMDGDGDLDLVSIAWRNSAYLHLWRNDAVTPVPKTPEKPTSLQLYGSDPHPGIASYYLPIEVSAGGAERHDKIVEVAVNWTRRLQESGSSGPFDPASLRVVEVDARGRVMDASVPFQFDTLENYNAEDSAVGALVFVMQGKTPANVVRHYRVLFGPAGPSYLKRHVANQVTYEDIGEYEGFPTWKISTPRATYYYHQKSAGFASLIDADGNDWISYHPGGGPKGEYRGIPNVAPPQWHPGRPDGKKVSRVIHNGPLRLRLFTETEDEEWAATWDIYPHHARMTILRKGEEPYWILYEGTPGGEFNESDYWVNSAGTRFDSASYAQRQRWNGILPAPEWVYFGDQKLKRVLFLARHEHSDALDEYWHFGEGGMTVFGFGRGPRNEGWQRLTMAPSHLTIGFVETDQFTKAAGVIESAYRDVPIHVGRATEAW